MYTTREIRRSRDADWTPAVDITESSDCYVLRADLPGVAPESIDISLENQVLTLEGSRAAVGENGRRHHAERVSGRFQRRFTLPATVDGERIEARSVHGTLEITVPKLPEVLPRRIEIEAA